MVADKEADVRPYPQRLQPLQDDRVLCVELALDRICVNDVGDSTIPVKGWMAVLEIKCQLRKVMQNDD